MGYLLLKPYNLDLLLNKKFQFGTCHIWFSNLNWSFLCTDNHHQLHNHLCEKSITNNRMGGKGIKNRASWVEFKGLGLIG